MTSDKYIVISKDDWENMDITDFVDNSSIEVKPLSDYLSETWDAGSKSRQENTTVFIHKNLGGVDAKFDLEKISSDKETFINNHNFEL